MADAKDSKPKTKLVEIEEKILAFWTKEDIFGKTLKKGGKEFVFYDGPPFATGLPHFGHLLPTTIKDVIPRYKTMRGFHVTRRWGWDCHGLPVENLIEKELGLKSKKDIIEYGIGKFNGAAKAAVLRYANEWREIIPRIGRWVDMENDYRTMDAGYTQSVWWVFKSLHEKGLVYEGFKSMQLCPRCETTLSNFEVNLGYKDITDISVFVRLELVNEPNTYFLAWTTTPWTLPGNVALAVGADIDYVRVSSEGKTYIVAKERAAEVFAGKNHEIGNAMKGSELRGLAYKPLFPYYNSNATKNIENGFKVYTADFVTTTDGTGIVHIAPAFGEDDMKLGEREKLPFIQHVGTNGRFKPEVLDFAGLEVKPADDEKDSHQKTDIEVIKWLAHNGFLFEKKKIVHSYPHCWRCSTPLLNYASSSWFVRVTDFKDKLVAANKGVSWVPSDIRDGRFGKWLENARDWAISRSRFWGAPIPVWRGVESGKIYCAGSLTDLSKLIKKSGNTYMIMRHGESEANIRGISNSDVSIKFHLTDHGREQVRDRAREIAKEGIDLIIASDFQRTKETAHIVADICGLFDSQIIYDPRLREYKVGPEREGKLWSETDRLVREYGRNFPGMETPAELKKRVLEALYDIDRKHSNKKILIISHGSPLNTLLHGVTETAGHDKVLHDERRFFKTTAEMHKLDFVRLPHDENFDLDLHRPFIDKVECVAPDGEALVRVPEVFDCWFESGSMPYGEACYMGENKDTSIPGVDVRGIWKRIFYFIFVWGEARNKPVKRPWTYKDFNPKGGLFKKTSGFPADFIAEGLDQTRGWFYSMLVLGVGLFGKSPYKNVIVNGLVLAEDGQKMSKSKNNYPPLVPTLEKYGADSLRYFFASCPAVKAEDVRFSEKGVDEISKKLLQRLDNVLAFYEMYAGELKSESETSGMESKNVLDLWIFARLTETRNEITEALERYQIDRAARPLMSFVDDLSTWYLRRSRDRFKSDDASDKRAALTITRYILGEFSKIAAPFIPFYADYLYAATYGRMPLQSVHLAAWPEYEKLDTKLISDMAEVRRLVTLGLEQRAKANIKVRQPLSLLSVRHEGLSPELLSLIEDEVNVKSVIVDPKIEMDVFLDTKISEELKKEGVARDLIRSIQELRKTEGLTVGDKVVLLLESDEKGKELVRAYMQDIMKVTLITGVEYAHLPHSQELAIEEFRFKIGFKK